MNHARKSIQLASVALLAAACSESATSPSAASKDLGSPRTTIAATGTVVVTEASVARQDENTLPSQSWVLYTRPTADVESGDFVIGPDTPPLGVGSFRTVTATGGSKVWLFNYDHIGTLLSDISAISYSTWKAPGVTAVAFPSINIEIDKNGGALVSGDYANIVFEPYLQSGFVDATGVWQSRDAFNGGAAEWWSNRVTECPNANPCTWTELLALYPNATILGGFGINQGSGNDGTDGATDALALGYGGNTITYDFDPYVTASSKASCMNGGWMNVKRADGSSFRNQGDCIAYLNTGL